MLANWAPPVAGQAGAPVTGPGPAWDTPANRNLLAGVLAAEQGTRPAENVAVGWTILNRMISRGTNRVAPVVRHPQYARPARPSAINLIAATMLLRGDFDDPTSGAENYFSPRGMPGPSGVGPGGIKCGPGAASCGGGLRPVPGVPGRAVYFPRFASPGLLVPQPAGTDPWYGLYYLPRKP